MATTGRYLQQPRLLSAFDRKNGHFPLSGFYLGDLCITLRIGRLFWI